MKKVCGYLLLFLIPSLLFFPVVLVQGQDTGTNSHSTGSSANAGSNSSSGSAPSGSQAKDNSAQSDTAKKGDNPQRKSKAQDALQAQIDQLNAVLQKLQEAQKSAQQVYQAQQQGTDSPSSPDQVPGLLEEQKRLIETKLQRGRRLTESHTQPLPPIDSRVQPIPPQELSPLPSVAPLPKISNTSPSLPQNSTPAPDLRTAPSVQTSPSQPNSLLPSSQEGDASAKQKNLMETLSSLRAASSNNKGDSKSDLASLIRPGVTEQNTKTCISLFEKHLPIPFSCKVNPAFENFKTFEKSLGETLVKGIEAIAQLTKSSPHDDGSWYCGAPPTTIGLTFSCSSGGIPGCSLNYSPEVGEDLRHACPGISTSSLLQGFAPNSTAGGQPICPFFVGGLFLCQRCPPPLCTALLSLKSTLDTLYAGKPVQESTINRILGETRSAIQQALNQAPTSQEKGEETLCHRTAQLAVPFETGPFSFLSEEERKTLFEAHLRLLQTQGWEEKCSAELTHATEGPSSLLFVSRSKALLEELLKENQGKVTLKDLVSNVAPLVEKWDTVFTGDNSPWQCLAQATTSQRYCPALHAFPPPDLLGPILTEVCAPVRMDTDLPVLTDGPSCSFSSPCHLWKLLQSADTKGNLDLSLLTQRLAIAFPSSLIAPQELKVLEGKVQSLSRSVTEIISLSSGATAHEKAQAVEKLTSLLTQQTFQETLLQASHLVDELFSEDQLAYTLILNKLKSLPVSKLKGPAGTCLGYVGSTFHHLMEVLHPGSKTAPQEQEPIHTLVNQSLFPLRIRLQSELGVLIELTFQYLIQAPHPELCAGSGLNCGVPHPVVLTALASKGSTPFIPNLIYSLGTLYQYIQEYLNTLACTIQEEDPQSYPKNVEELLSKMALRGSLLFSWNTPIHQSLSIEWIRVFLRTLQCLTAQGDFSSACDADHFFSGDETRRQILNAEFSPLLNKAGSLDVSGDTRFSPEEQKKDHPLSGIFQKTEAILRLGTGLLHGWSDYFQAKFSGQDRPSVAKTLTRTFLFQDPFIHPEDQAFLKSHNIESLGTWPNSLLLFQKERSVFTLAPLLGSSPETLDSLSQNTFEKKEGWDFDALLSNFHPQCASRLRSLEKKVEEKGASSQGPASLVSELQTLYPVSSIALSDTGQIETIVARGGADRLIFSALRLSAFRGA